MIVKVDTYISNPLHCYNCQKFRHHKSRCTRVYVKKKKKKNGENGSDYPESTCKQFKSASCSGDHSADSRLCAAWKREKEILKIKYTQDIPFPEARKIVETTLAAQSYLKPFSCVQSDEVTLLNVTYKLST